MWKEEVSRREFQLLLRINDDCLYDGNFKGRLLLTASSLNIFYAILYPNIFLGEGTNFNEGQL